MKIRYFLPVSASIAMVMVAAPFCFSSAKEQENKGEVRNEQSGSLVPLTCSLSLSKKSFRKGEDIKVGVQIKNEQEKAIYLVNVLDGSEDKMRYPYCYFEIRNAQGQIVKPRMLRCGNTNQLVSQDFVKVQPKASFYPFKAAFFNPYILYVAKKTMKPGDYTLRFIYSTQDPSIQKWLGDRRLGQTAQQDKKLIIALPVGVLMMK